MVVHSILPPRLTEIVEAVLSAAGVRHVAHGDADPVSAAVSATRDPDAVAVIGPLRSRDVAETAEVTSPAGLPLIAPVATWVGVTRRDEPGSEDDPADNRGTNFRMVARDSVVAERIARRLRDARQSAIVIAGDHEYGEQLDRQLASAGLPRTSDPHTADVVVLAGLAGSDEMDAARALAPMPIIGFDGIQGEAFPQQAVEIAVVYAAGDTMPGETETRRAAELIVEAIARGGNTVGRLRELGPFDDYGDLIDPPVRFERYPSTSEYSDSTRSAGRGRPNT